jgi:hypothetical protein
MQRTVVEAAGGPVEVVFRARADLLGVGTRYVGDDHVTFALQPTRRALAERGVERMRRVSFADDAMRREMTGKLPVVRSSQPLRDGGLLVVIEKSPEQLVLADVLAYYGGVLDPRHVAWIQSTLQHMCCYLAFAGIVHHDLSPASYFINPVDHSGALLGGWWFAASVEQPVSVVPARTYPYLPVPTRDRKVAVTLTDAILARRLGLELLGDISGATVSATAPPAAPPKGRRRFRLRETSVPVPPPAPMVAFLKAMPTGGAVESYGEWMRVIVAAFGKREFTEMPLTADLVYVEGVNGDAS